MKFFTKILLTALLLGANLYASPSFSITSTPETNATQDGVYSYTLGATNVNKDDLTWSVTSGSTLPSWLELKTTPSSATTLINSGLNLPFGVAVDSSGNLYIVDTNNNAIKKRDANGTVTTLIDSGLNSPHGIALDNSGNLYIADTNNNAIKKRDTNGTVTTLIGSGLNKPYGVAVDSSGNLYIADAYNKAVKKRDINGTVTTLIGSGLNSPAGIVVDSSGNLYVTDSFNDKVFKRDTNGTVTTLISTGLQRPFGVALDSKGNLYIAGTDHSVIKKIDTNGTVTTFIDSGLMNPYGVAFDSNGNLYIADTSSNTIKMLAAPYRRTSLSGTPSASDVGVHDINITLSDGNGATLTQNFQITVANVNDAPTDIALSSHSIAENNAIGDTIGNLSTTDADTGDTFTFSFCGGTNDTSFILSGTTLKANEVFDYETKSSYSVCIRTTDNAGATFDKNITINITDVNEVPTVIPTPTPTPTPQPEPTPAPTPPSKELLRSAAETLETNLELETIEDRDNFIVVIYRSKVDGTQSQIVIPKIIDKLINIAYNSASVELTLDNAIASYNNNGTTEHSNKTGENEATIAISYIAGSSVVFRPNGSVATSVKYSGEDNASRDILIVATAEGFSQNSIMSESNVITKVDINILGTKTLIQEDGSLVIETPAVVSNTGNKLAIKATTDVNGNVQVIATKIDRDGNKNEISLGNYKAATEINIEFMDGKVVFEVITSLESDSPTLRNGRK